MIVIPLTPGFSVEDIQAIASAVVVFFVDFVIVLYQALGALGGATVSSTGVHGIDISRD